MLVFCIKQLLSLKRAILGRREPHQLAWGLALGIWLGVVPYGNLVALAILLFILSVRVNHGMVAVTAVATSVIAARFDAQTHAVGQYVLTHPQYAPQLASAWQWPLVPWTDLNNTVVMGGLLLGFAAVVPAYLLTYPLFRYLAPPAADLQAEDPQQRVEPCDATATADELPAPTPAPALAALPPVAEATGSDETIDSPVLASCDEPDALATDAASVDQGSDDQASEDDPALELIDTRIEVVRLIDAPVASEPAVCEPAAAQAAAATQPVDEPALPVETVAEEAPKADPPVSEALNYLLRQLRDSRQRRAA